MKRHFRFLISLLVLTIFSCEKLDDFLGHANIGQDDEEVEVNFTFRKTIQVGGEGAAEISAFDPSTNKLFVVNVEVPEISVFDISDLSNPKRLTPINSINSGLPNSVAVHNGRLAVAIEAMNKQANGFIELFDTYTQEERGNFEVGALPDMVTFTPNGKYVISANEGEPDDDYLIGNDPDGTVSIIDMETQEVTTLDFIPFEGQKTELLDQGFRIFGPDRSFATDVEPEYVAVADDSKTAWVVLQENNGIAVVDLESKQIQKILPLGFKDYSLPGNEIDPSDKDGQKVLANYPVFGMYQPDGMDYVKINGTDYIITANEGDAREYEGNPGFIEEQRVEDVVLDPISFPNAEMLQDETVLGRLKITNTLGDPDGDGLFNELYNYGARSFSIWTGDGALIYDSGNDIAKKTLSLTPNAFNGEDGRSDDKGAEPEGIEIIKLGNKYILFVGLERNNQIMVYDISDPYSPEFIDILSYPGDIGPEGLLAISAEDSPTGNELLIVSNEVSGGVTFYEN